MAAGKKGEPPNQKKTVKKAVLRNLTPSEAAARAKAKAKKGEPPNQTRTPRGSGTSATEKRPLKAVIRRAKKK